MSFVPGRQGLNNVVICQEYVHSLRFTKVKKGVAIIKVDLKKAYDRLEWAFVESTMEDMGLRGNTVNVIMQLLSRGSCRLVWNEEATDTFMPSRGSAKGTHCPRTYSCSAWKDWGIGCAASRRREA